jgi:hypothetical protein
MSNINIFEEAKTLAEKRANVRLKRRLVDADA